MSRKMMLLTVGAVAFAGASQALAAPADLKSQADAYLKSAFSEAGPGAAVIITDDGKTVYAAGQGLADLETKAPITPATVFRMGSITKQFSAAVILQLAAEGKLSLDDRLSKYLPDFPKPGADATIAQLLNHTVGVQSYTAIPGWMVEANTGRAYTTEEMIALFKDLPAPSKPGEKWGYNNSGYVLVGAVIEKVTGKPWHEAVEERIAKPLGLQTIRYGVVETAMPKMAKGYTEGEKGVELARKIHLSVPHAAGALIGSVEDLAKWNHALHHGKVVPATFYARMVAATAMPDGTSAPYGFGLGVEELRGRPAVGHGGGIFGFSTRSIYLPEDDVFVAVFTNSDDPVASPDIVMRRLAGMAIGDPYPAFQKAPADAASLEPLFGVYAVKDGERRFYSRDGKLYTRRSGGSDQEVFAAGDDRFFYGPDMLTWFEIERDPAGKHSMAVYQQGAKQAEPSTRTGPIPPEPKLAKVPRPTLERYVGAYKASMGTATVAFGEGDALTLRLGGQPATTLRPVSATQFLVDGVDARITFTAEGERVSGLLLKQGAREIRADRVID